MKLLKKLIGERIYLAPIDKEASEIFAEWLNDFDTTDYIVRSSQLVTVDDEIEYFEKQSKDDTARNFFIVTLEDDKIIGTVSLERISFINRSATLGIFIGDKNYRNDGYGTEAIKLILDFGFNYINLNSIKLEVLDVNERAQKCYKKCGFKEYGHRRECRFINGKYYGVIMMDILNSEFKESYIKNKNL